MRWLFDTGIWLHLGQSEAVRTAVASVHSRPHEVVTAPITIAEIVSVLLRRGHSDLIAPVLSQVRRGSAILGMDPATFETAGRLHAAERAHAPDVSLSDAFILAAARESDATLLTTDRALAQNHQSVRARLVSLETRKKPRRSG